MAESEKLHAVEKETIDGQAKACGSRDVNEVPAEKFRHTQRCRAVLTAYTLPFLLLCSSEFVG